MGDRAIGHWANEKAQRRHDELYASLVPDLWQSLCDAGQPGPPVEHDVPTRYGTTHAYEWTGDGPPIVLLPGAGTWTVMWLPVIAELTGRRVIAIDTIGQPGRSVQREPVPDVAALVAWLDESLAALALSKVTLVGASYGGWAAYQYALASQARLEHLVLVEPVMTKIRPYFWAHGFMAVFAMATPRPVRVPWLRRLHMGMAADGDPRIVEMARLGFTRYRGGVPKFRPLTDEELAAAATVPVRVLLAGESELHHTAKLAARLHAVAPRLEVEVVPGTGHALPVERPDLVAARIREVVETTTGADVPDRGCENDDGAAAPR
jgi:pimeloyl-ACP methyl ester carboxylesterase